MLKFMLKRLAVLVFTSLVDDYDDQRIYIKFIGH